MTLDGYVVLLILVLMVVALAKEILRPGLIFFSGVAAFMALGIVDSTEALNGFSNKGMITIAILFIVSEGVRQTGGLNYLAKIILPKKKEKVSCLLYKVFFPVAGLSAFMNNTPVVIILAPMIKRWAEKLDLPASKFLIPLSYATILGGACTLIGTSTNLVVHGMMLDAGFQGLGMFETGKVGLIVGLVGFVYLFVFGNMLLPGERITDDLKFTNFREYYFEVIVPEGSPFVGKVFEKRIIEGLKEFRVSSILRKEKMIKTTKGEYTIEAGDILTLAGKSDSLDQLVNIDGLNLMCLEGIAESFRHQDLKQVEAVISARFPGVGKTYEDFDFQSHYGAVLMAIHRNGVRISSNLGQMEMKDGDNLILLATDKFLKNWGDSRVFYTTSYLGDISKPERKRKMWLSIIVVLGMVIGAATLKEYKIFDKIHMDMFFFASLAAVIMVWTKIIPARMYTKVMSWDILITIACAFGIAKGLQNSGLADGIAAFTIDVTRRYGPLGVLAGIYLLTNFFTEIITNNAAAAISFPIAMAAANQLGVDPRPFFIAICIAASASFSTPIGYQTNLIVQGIGGYRFKDYMKIGLPLNLLCFAVSVWIIPLIWEF